MLLDAQDGNVRKRRVVVSDAARYSMEVLRKGVADLDPQRTQDHGRRRDHVGLMPIGDDVRRQLQWHVLAIVAV